jgi:solute carrier family 25 (adenine nucleotide translocator) protein 4/5/6/31
MWANMGAGWAAGVGSTLVTYPLSLAHIAGAADTALPNKRVYSGMGSYMYRVVKKNGPFALYRGVLVSLLGVPVHRGVQFGLFDTFNAVNSGHNSAASAMLSKFALAQISAMAGALAAHPFTVVQTRLAANAHATSTNPPTFSGVISTFRTTVHQDGVRGLWRGALFTLWTTPASALVLVLYDEAKRAFGFGF